MELLIGLIVVVVILFVFLGGGKKESVSAKTKSFSKEEKILNENADWMSERWEFAKKEKASGEITFFPEWFFDDATERQLQKIEEIGLKISGG